MSYKRTRPWYIQCDRCEAQTELVVDIRQAERLAMRLGWSVSGNKHFCASCWEALFPGRRPCAPTSTLP